MPAVSSSAPFLLEPSHQAVNVPRGAECAQIARTKASRAARAVSAWAGSRREIKVARRRTRSTRERVPSEGQTRRQLTRRMRRGRQQASIDRRVQLACPLLALRVGVSLRDAFTVTVAVRGSAPAAILVFFCQDSAPTSWAACSWRCPGEQGRDLLVPVTAAPAPDACHVKDGLSVDCGKPQEGLYIAGNHWERRHAALLVEHRDGIAPALQANRPAVDRAMFAKSSGSISVVVASAQIGAKHEYLSGLTWRVRWLP